MLARTGDSLYWLARYMERADFLARTIEAARRLAVLPMAYRGEATEWENALAAAGAVERFKQSHDTLDETSVVEFLAFDHDNPSSIRNCIEFARTNARGVRAALTFETWQSLNGGWLALNRFEDNHHESPSLDRDALGRFLDMVKKTALDVDGSAHRTMLRNDAYWFSRLGLYIERADNTARILDVKHHMLSPDIESAGRSFDYFQWTAILRAVSALDAYHWVYRENVKPCLIADLLVLRSEMPRSLIFCYDNIVHCLDAIAKTYGHSGAAQRHARSVKARLQHVSLNELFTTGLHEFITAFFVDNNLLGTILAEQYLLS